MPRFSANLSYLFTEVPFVERFAAAASAGFEAVEFHFPYEYAIDELAERIAAAGVEVVLFNLPPGNWAASERGIACHPGRESEFRDGLGRAIDFARALGCKRVNALAGIAPPGASEDRLRRTFIDNLAFAARALEREGIALVIEPINTRSMPGFYLNRSQQALEIIREVNETSGETNVKIQYDLFHMQIMEGDLAHTLETLLPHIGHVQFADAPGRHEPGTGEINFPFLFGHLDRIGYDGWVGAEYAPLTSTRESLAWLDRARRDTRASSR